MGTFIISGTLNSPPGDLKGSFCCLAFEDSLPAALVFLLDLPIKIQMDGGYSNSSCSCVHVAQKSLLHILQVMFFIFYGILFGNRNHCQWSERQISKRVIKMSGPYICCRKHEVVSLCQRGHNSVNGTTNSFAIAAYI